MLSDDELVAGFEAASITDFHHAEHVRLTFVYLERFGRDEALIRLSRGIQRLADAAGHPEKFHVTLTRAWFELIELARAATPAATTPGSLVAAFPALLDSKALARCYSRERLESEQARTQWLPPDLEPLHSAFDWHSNQRLDRRHNVSMPSADPITAFLEAVRRAEMRQVDTAPVALATADAQGRPSARMVLLRGVDARGFAFFTNYASRKGRELTENPYAALCVHWPTLEEQIRIEGRVEKLPDRESDEYFAGRPRGSQIGAWASDQSRILLSPDALEERYRDVERRFDGRAVERPPFWGGFRIIPDRVEFWFGRADRLHERLLYRRDADAWRTERLYP
jgi:pyridoxamine 5'-phosphate oxidase